MGLNFVGQNLTGHHFRMCTSIYLMVSIPESSKPLLSYQTDFYLEIDTCFKIQYVKHVTVTCVLKPYRLWKIFHRYGIKTIFVYSGIKCYSFDVLKKIVR